MTSTPVGTAQRTPRGPRLRWIVAGSILVVAIIVVIGVVLVTHKSSPEAAPTGSPKQTYLARLTDTMEAAGGDWTFEDGTTAWTETGAETYESEPCLSGAEGDRRYSMTVRSEGRADVEAAVKAVTARWQQRGYAVRTVSPRDSTNDDATEIAADVDGGALVDYAVSTSQSSITTESECFASK